MVEADQVGAQLAGAPLRGEVILGAHKESPARTLFCCVRQPEGGDDLAVVTEQCAAAFVRVGVNSMLTDGVRHSCLKLECH